jgi:hypothetical protein
VAVQPIATVPSSSSNIVHLFLKQPVVMAIVSLQLGPLQSALQPVVMAIVLLQFGPPSTKDKATIDYLGRATPLTRGIQMDIADAKDHVEAVSKRKRNRTATDS